MDTEIKICFPDKKDADKERLINEIIEGIEYNKEIGYAGFPTKEELEEHLNGFLGNQAELYSPLTKNEREELTNTISSALKTCEEYLHLPFVQVYAFPWFAKLEGFIKLMGGTNGVAPHSNALHLYITPTEYYPGSLQKTVAHEFNHAVFFYEQGVEEHSILKVLIFEGLAENFEEKISGERNVVSKAIEREHSKKILSQIWPHLETIISFEKDSFYRQLFFGSEEYAMWTGYTIGYEIVSSFIEENPNMSWQEIMKTPPEEIFQNSPFVRSI